MIVPKRLVEWQTRSILHNNFAKGKKDVEMGWIGTTASVRSFDIASFKSLCVQCNKEESETEFYLHGSLDDAKVLHSTAYTE